MKVALLESRLVQHSTQNVPSSASREQSAAEAVVGILLVLSLAGMGRVAVDPAPYMSHGFRLDRITATMALLVAAIGLAAVRYGARCLQGQAQGRRLTGWMAAATTASWLLALADGFVVLLLAWVAVGICLQSMLSWRMPGRTALSPASCALRLSLFGDLMLACAFAVAWIAYGSGGLSSSVERMATDSSTAWTTAIVLLACGACVVKTAQVPAHGWLPSTVDAPTPVSALMHAGIINAGGVMLVRMAPAIDRVPEAWLLLSLVGSASMLVAVPTAWFQAKAKSALAWSTVGQMGFMLTQCGLCAFPAALLHVLGHGTYKAWSFLGAGEVSRAGPKVPDPVRALGLLMVGTLASVAGVALSLRLLDMPAPTTPGKLALLAVVCIATGQCWVALLGDRTSHARRAAQVSTALTLSVAIPSLALSLYAVASAWIGLPGEATPPSRGAMSWMAAIVPVLTIVSLAVLHALLPSLERCALGQQLRVHASNGFHLWALVVNRGRRPRTARSLLNSGASHA